MNQIERFAARLRNRLLFAFNALSFLIMLVYAVAKALGTDTLAGPWVLCWGIALGLWVASFITFLMFKVRVPNRNAETD